MNSLAAKKSTISVLKSTFVQVTYYYIYFLLLLDMNHDALMFCYLLSMAEMSTLLLRILSAEDRYGSPILFQIGHFSAFLA